jgi:hypothetical protein
MITPQLIECIKHAEACKLTAYRDTKGLWTIGWGHLMDQSKDQTGVTWTQQQADEQLMIDLSKAVTQTAELPETKGLDQPRFDAIAELVYNMGLGTDQPPNPHGYKSFTRTRVLIAQREFGQVYNNLMTSKWAADVKGARAWRVASQLYSGEYVAP